jgi:hypothetical protein
MKKLTKLQRHTAYLIMLEEAEDETSYAWCVFSPCLAGFCHMVNIVFNLGNGMHESAIRFHFPELYKQKPQTAGRFWFAQDHEGWIQRRKLLQNAINETA